MKKDEKIEKYGAILESLNEMRSAVVQDAAGALMVSGVMPESGQKELKVLSGITSSVFCALSTLGVEIKDDEDTPGVVYADVLGKKYSCAKGSLDTFYEISKQTLSVSEASVVLASEEKPREEENVPAPVVEEEKPAPILKPEQKTEEIILEEEEDEEIVLPTKTEEPLPFVEERPKEAFVEKEEEESEPVVFDVSEEAPSDEPRGFVFEEDEPEDEAPAEPEKTFEEKAEEYAKEEEEWTLPGSKVIGGGISTVKKSDIFMDEFKKAGETFVYSFLKLSVMHTDGGRPEEVLAMIAPLKMYKTAQVNVPIVVTLSNRGITKTASSYDTEREGKNTVQTEISGFYFLVRGAFDDNGRFTPSIVTTGISAQVGDKISIIHQKTCGCAQDRDAINGHIKFHADTDEGPGYIEVFPFGDPSEGDYTVIVKNDEFATPYFVSESLKGNKSVVVYDKETTIPYELKITWDDDNEELSAELVKR